MEAQKAKRAKTGGRVAGTPNKATQEFRQTVQALLDENRSNVPLWLAKVAKEDPGKALDLLTKLAEFAAPKLSRKELAGGFDVNVISKEQRDASVRAAANADR